MANTASAPSGNVNWTQSALNMAPAAINGFFGWIGAHKQREHETALAAEQRDWNEQMQDKANAWSLDMWNKTNEYNSPTAQVERLREAGLNPLYYGLDGSSANAIQSAQALGYDRASVAGMTNPLQAGIEGALSAASLKKDIELKNAQIDKLGEEASGTKLDNEFKERTMSARVEGEKLANDMSKEQIENVKKQREQIEADIKKKIAETESEQERKSLIIAQTAVQKATEKQLVELLPLQKNLMEAQTEAQKAAAAASYANALYQNKLIDSGYIDELVRAQKGTADNAAALAAINEFKNAVKHGNIFTIEEGDNFIEKGGKQFINGLFNDVSIIAEALTGGLQGILK